MGLKIKKIHRGITFEESPWLEKYMALNTKLRTVAKNEFEKDFFKLMNNSVFGNFFKHLLLPNRWANLDETWQECSLRGPLQTSFTEFDSIENSGCHGNEIEFFKQFFKNLLLWNRLSDFEINSQENSLGDPFFKNRSRNFDPPNNMALVNGGFLHYMDMKKFFKKTFCSKTDCPILK